MSAGAPRSVQLLWPPVEPARTDLVAEALRIDPATETVTFLLGDEPVLAFSLEEVADATISLASALAAPGEPGGRRRPVQLCWAMERMDLDAEALRIDPATETVTFLLGDGPVRVFSLEEVAGATIYLAALKTREGGGQT